jgi:integrase
MATYTLPIYNNGLLLMAKKLTDKGIERIKPPVGKAQEEHWDTEVSGLGLRVGAKGTKAFTLLIKTYVMGKKKNIRLTLGRFPAMSLAEARALAKEYKTYADQGKDPRKAKQDAEREKLKASRFTFAACRDDFLEAGAKYGIGRGRKRAKSPWREKTLKDNTWALSKFNDWADLSIKDISEHDIADALSEIEDGVAGTKRSDWSGASAAHRSFEVLNTMMNWCMRKRLIEHSPCQFVEEVPDKLKRDRVIDDDELSAIWKSCDEYSGPLADCLKLLILTGQRLREVSELKWSEVAKDRSAFTLDGNRTKNGLPHVIPLSELARSVIDAQHKDGEFVFTTTGNGPVVGFSKLKKNIEKLSGVSNWRIHDFRRTMVTGMNEMGIAPHVVEVVVNHISGEAKAEVAGIYNKAQYLEARRNALDVWADHVGKVVNGQLTVSGNVVELGASQ